MTTAADVRECLASRWPDNQYLRIDEAPQDAMRQGRKLDVLAVSLWSSRGFELDGVEIKVSYHDWQRELVNAGKADWWWRHVHRFWVAVPAQLAPRVQPELPSTWGLLACEDGKTKALVKAPQAPAEPLPWTTCIGLMRAASGAGANALQRAHTNGFEEGRAAGRREAAAGHAQLTIDRLRQTIADFESASGVKIEDWNGAYVGKAVAVVRRAMDDPDLFTAAVAGLAQRLQAQAGQLGKLASELPAALGTACSNNLSPSSEGRR